MTIKEQIHAAYMRMSKEQLIQMLDDDANQHNEFCKKAGVWRTAMLSSALALKPFAEAADELDDEAARALEVGGYVPTTEEWATREIRAGLLYAAREAFKSTRAQLVEKFEAEIKAARLCIATLKELEQQGNMLAVQTLTAVRQVDPHV